MNSTFQSRLEALILCQTLIGYSCLKTVDAGLPCESVYTLCVKVLVHMSYDFCLRAYLNFFYTIKEPEKGMLLHFAASRQRENEDSRV